MRAHLGSVFLGGVGLFVLQRKSERRTERNECVRGVEALSKSEQQSQITHVHWMEQRDAFLRASLDFTVLCCKKKAKF